MTSPRRPIDVGVSGAPSPLAPTRVVGGGVQGEHVVNQRRGRPLRAEREPTQLASPAFDVAGAHPNALVLLSEAARHLRYQGERAPEICAKFLRSKHIKLLRRGTRLLVRRGDLDLALTQREDPAVAAVTADITDQIAIRRLKRAAVG